MVNIRVVVSLLISLSIAGQGACYHGQEQQLSKRDNIVYVTVTEYRYVPIPPPIAVAQPPAFPQPVSALTGSGHPAQLPSIAAPIVISWQTNSNDALTYTSYAGLLSTVAPAFYPLPSSAVALPVPATPAPMTASLTAPSSQTFTPTSSAVWTPIPVWVSTHHSSDTTTPLSSLSTSVVSSATSQLTSTSTDVTISTSTTTRVDSVTTSTSVGSDGTTTVMTEYPSPTRPHGAQSTSGADSRLLRLRADEQTYGFVSFHPAGAVGVAIAVALTIPGVFLLAV